MCEATRFFHGDEFVKKENEFIEGIEQIQNKHSEYFKGTEHQELSSYIITHTKDNNHSMTILTGLRNDIIREVQELFKSIWN